MGLVLSCCSSAEQNAFSDDAMAVIIADPAKGDQRNVHQGLLDETETTSKEIGAVQLRHDDGMPSLPRRSRPGGETGDAVPNPFRNEAPQSSQSENSPPAQAGSSPSSCRRVKLRPKPQLEHFGSTFRGPLHSPVLTRSSKSFSAPTPSNIHDVNRLPSSPQVGSICNSSATSVDHSMPVSSPSRRRSKGSCVRFHEFAMLPIAVHVSQESPHDDNRSHGSDIAFGILVSGQNSSNSHPYEVTMDEVVFPPHDVNNRGEDDEVRTASLSELVALSTQESVVSSRPDDSEPSQRCPELSVQPLTPKTVSLKTVPLVDTPYSRQIAHRTQPGK